MSHRFRVRPGAVETREVAGPQEVAHADLGHAAETALFLDLEGEEELAPDELARLVRQRDIGRKDAARRPAEFVLAVKAPEHEGHPADARFFEHEAYRGMAFANARENDGAHQSPHPPHRDIGHPHQRLITRPQPLPPPTTPAPSPP